MKTLTGTIKEIGALDSESNRGGIISYITIGNDTIRRVHCATDVYDFLKPDMEAEIYLHGLPLMAKVILGVKNTRTGNKFMLRPVELVASVIMRFVTLAAIALPVWLLSDNFFIAAIIPGIAPVTLLIDYISASAKAEIKTV